MAASERPLVISRATVQDERQPAGGDPEAACRHQQLVLAREICNVAQCETPEWRSHPVCVRRLAEQRMRDQLAEQALRTR